MITELVQRLGHRVWFARVVRRLVPADRLVGRLTRGWVVAFGLMPSLVITTTGRRSGLPRDNPLLYVRDGTAYVVVGSNWGQPHQPAWALNLLADPHATVTVRGQVRPVRARLAQGAERDRLWRLLVARWPAYETYARRAAHRDIKLFRLEPDPDTPVAPPVDRPDPDGPAR